MWFTGGETSSYPGSQPRWRAMRGDTFLPGSWPPFPGFAPWANFTSASAARAAVIGVTVKRAPAYWMLRLPSGPPMRDLSNPPSPLFAIGPMPAGAGTPARRNLARQ